MSDQFDPSSQQIEWNKITATKRRHEHARTPDMTHADTPPRHACILLAPSARATRTRQQHSQRGVDVGAADMFAPKHMSIIVSARVTCECMRAHVAWHECGRFDADAVAPDTAKSTHPAHWTYKTKIGSGNILNILYIELGWPACLCSDTEYWCTLY